MFHVEQSDMTTKGLGKGLGALIAMFDEDMQEIVNKPEQTESNSIAELSSKKESVSKYKNLDNDEISGVQEINISLIDRNLSQPRKAFNAEEMHELEQSISAHGVLQPILLNKVGTRYMVVAGERRLRASKTLGLKTIPALVRDYTPKQIAEISLVENLMRSDLNEIEIALGIKKLVETYNMTQDQVSTVIGKSRSSVANSLRMLNLPQEVQELLEQKQITFGHAKCLASITDKAHCIALAKKCAGGTMTVRELEIASSNKPWNKVLTLPKFQSLELRELAIVLTQSLAAKVSVTGDENGGKITIEYSSVKDLERIKNKLK
jgi:ParB family chromosome partitioning protein